MGWAEGVLVGLSGVASLVLLGVLRERALMREVSAADRAPAALVVGAVAPAALSPIIDGRLVTSAGTVHYLAVLGSGCGACEGYARRLAEAVATRGVNTRDITVVARGRPSVQLVERLRSSGVMAVHDEGGELLRGVMITKTPTTVGVDTATRLVRGIWIGDDDPPILTRPLTRNGERSVSG